jgi:hypothetical protein
MPLAVPFGMGLLKLVLYITFCVEAPRIMYIMSVSFRDDAYLTPPSVVEVQFDDQEQNFTDVCPPGDLERL